jgi:hypothetical protein
MAGAKEFSLLQSGQVVSGAPSSSYSMDTMGLLPGTKLTIHLHFMLALTSPALLQRFCNISKLKLITLPIIFSFLFVRTVDLTVEKYYNSPSVIACFSLSSKYPQILVISH